MTPQQHYLLVLVIALIGLICSGCLETNVDADTFLRNVAEKQANIENLTYTEIFTFHIGEETRTVEYDATLKTPDKFRRIERIGSIIRSETVSNGDIVWIYDPEVNILFIRNSTPSEKIPEPSIYALLTDNITEKYIIEDQDVGSLNSISVRKVKLSPRELDNEDMREYLIWIDSDSLIPLKLESYDKGNLMLTLEYQDYSINCITDDNEFTFAIPAGASVVYA
ncbi:LolA family protein [Methanoculleus sp. 7T]|uniref:LolA family protein n=1 Tax=Methanoculleus sp. 7T TaxID=2937282 RepID=UPI0020BDBDBC|nr:outer membrane lipoprotein-sorting protein [Methanoculleus sp. 7T]MCK8519675.1 outer membrane lipoprotein-sorting protein [Methanoculleus sp. 7T]